MDISKICQYTNEYYKYAISPLITIPYLSTVISEWVYDAFRSMKSDLSNIKIKLDQSVKEVESHIQTFSNQENFANVKPTLDSFKASAITTSGLINQIILDPDVSKKQQEAQAFINSAQETLRLFPFAVQAIKMNKTTIESFYNFITPWDQVKLETLMNSITPTLTGLVQQVQSVLVQAQEQAKLQKSQTENQAI